MVRLSIQMSHTYCFVCHTMDTRKCCSQSSQTQHELLGYVGSATRLQKRNISEKTCEKYKIYKDGDVLRFYYHNADGQPIGAKTRTNQRYSPMKARLMDLSLVNTYGKVKVSELSLLKESLMLQRTMSMAQLGLCISPYWRSRSKEINSEEL